MRTRSETRHQENEAITATTLERGFRFSESIQIRADVLYRLFHGIRPSSPRSPVRHSRAIGRYGARHAAAMGIAASRRAVCGAAAPLDRASEGKSRRQPCRRTGRTRPKRSRNFVAVPRASCRRELHRLAALHGLVVSRVSVRNQRSRWGSCSPSGHICLNWRLDPDARRGSRLRADPRADAPSAARPFAGISGGSSPTPVPSYEDSRRWLRKARLISIQPISGW